MPTLSHRTRNSGAAFVMDEMRLPGDFGHAEVMAGKCCICLQNLTFLLV